VRGLVALASSDIAAACQVLSPRRMVFVPTAANGLEDRQAIIDATLVQLERHDIEVVELDLEGVDGVGAHSLDSVDAVVVGGGNPYRLLAAMGRSGFDQVVRDAVDGGLPYLGVSAGAMVAGPSLRPLVDVSPFDAPPDVGDGVGLVPLVVLPHDGRPGRRARHARAQRRHGAQHPMVAIHDDEVVLVDGTDRWRLVADRSSIRPGEVTDAAAIADTYADAGRAAWSFVDEARWAELVPPVEAWTDRLAGREAAEGVLVAEDDGGVCGFVWVRAASDPDLDPGTGELGALYTRPRVWGSGVGRRLLQLALDRLRARGASSAVLYTEERNARPRRLYERAGWRTDGAARERTFLGVAIREVRYRLALDA